MKFKKWIKPLISIALGIVAISVFWAVPNETVQKIAWVVAFGGLALLPWIKIKGR